MTPEEFDKKARDANNYTVPPFEEQDWNKMEFLLNRHLPQKKNKKRIFFWWFAALVPVVLTGLMLFNNYNPHNSEKSSFKKDLIKEKNDNVTSNQQPNEQQELNILKADAANNEKFNTDETSKKTDEETADNFNKQHKQKLVFGNSPNNIFLKNDNETSTENKNDEPVFKNDTYKNDITNASEPNVAIAITQKETVDQKDKKIAASLSDTLIDKDKNKTKSRSEPVAKKRAAKNNFYFTLTSGLESSGTRISNLGAVKPVYGAGLQYSSGKLFVRTGVLVTKKIYAAKDKDYNRKAGTWMSNVKFDNINANCKVVEVPLTVGYQISSNKKTNVYVAVGSSSYFMKQENYQFYFKGPTGNDTSRAARFKNNSNHYFSSINLSAGIEQKVTGKLSITAEPQIKIPIRGISFGKIKLYGAGVLITAKVKLK